MAITKAEFSAYIRAFQFRELFNEMGWNNDRTKQPIVLDEVAYNVTAIAEKSGFRIFICEPPSGNKIPDSATRKKIESKVTKLFQEHLIIFIDEYQREQVWQLAVRKAGTPTKISETRFTLSQDPELLYQRASGLFFTLDEEEKVTIIDVTKRVAENFQQNNERVTKKFYESFKKEHTAFLKFIKGIDDQLNMDWYASLMLNRLMFCYFIQKKGFLDKNKNYLQDKLKACKEKKGKNKFYSFYRDFLLALFHEGLGAPTHDKKLEVEIGKIPYLNGGLFDEHEIEKTFQKIVIDDKAFEQLFNFFDEWEWHLDTRESASGKDVNPDVIGYIFEKYINDRAQMGAYYTKEDITDYISKNCIIPWLFDEVKRHYPKAFANDGWLWQMLKKSGDEYIYDAVKYGVPDASTGSATGGLFDDLPAGIQKGFNPALEKKLVDGKGQYLHELRNVWNKHAPSNIALQTETYREVIERRKRYADIKSKIANGEIKEINDFITYNLNIRQFVQDVLETTGDAEFIRHFYQALLRITILDPTCGSGAFLFAALNILELLYEACIQRMRSFVDESGKGKHKYFEEMLAQVNAPEHPNLQYFIYKSIILNNLYGVDIMNEAVEIAKLRMFLKLVATVDADYSKKNLGLEPLPDVDFNIRAGNTLIGYATEDALKNSLEMDLIAKLELPRIEEQCDIVARAFARYKEIQLQGHADFEDFKTAKDELNDRLDKLRNELNQLLHKQHYPNVKYDHWLATHQPFHWFAEFYEIIHGKGGFDVVIGNPPYVEYKKNTSYGLINFNLMGCGNLYAFVVERSHSIINDISYFGMIVPFSSASTPRMLPLVKLLSGKSDAWLSSYDERPSFLFSGVCLQTSIWISNICKNEKKVASKLYTSRLLHWSTDQRSVLFESILSYLPNNIDNNSVLPLKIYNSLENSLMTNLSTNSKSFFQCQLDSSKHSLYYRTSGGRYFKLVTNFQPYFKDSSGRKTSSKMGRISMPDVLSRDIGVILLNSNFFYWYWRILSNCRDLTSREINSIKFDINAITKEENTALSNISNSLMDDLKKNAIRKTVCYKNTGEVVYDEHYVKLSKSLIDQIDCLLAQHYGFTYEELDFIINYDIKYRMGKELDNGEDDE